MYAYLCKVCGAGYQSWMKSSKYCSRACRDSSMRTVPPSSCLTCDQPVRKKKYCSPQCYWDSLKGQPSSKNTQVLVLCTVCGNETMIKAYRQEGFKYCSRKCYLSVHTANNTTPELDLLRHSAAYRDWRTAVFERDDYTCVICGDGNRKGRGETVVLHADHIKPFAHHPELRFDVGNGRTLCVPCHRATPTYGGGSRLKSSVAVVTS